MTVRRSLVRFRTAVVLAVALSTLGSPAALGHTKGFDNAVVVLRLVGSSYTGRVLSDKDPCFKNRLVKLYHDVVPLYKIGQARTTAAGTWKITGNVPSDHTDKVFAKVGTKYLANTDAHVHKCLGDKSPKVTVNSLLN